jgi:hypothetical protein
MTKLDYEKDRQKRIHKSRGNLVNPKIDNELEFSGLNDLIVAGNKQELDVYKSFQKKVRLVYSSKYEQLCIDDQFEVLGFIRRWHKEFTVNLEGYSLNPVYRQAERIIRDNQINLLNWDKKRLNELELITRQFLNDQSRKDLKKLIRRIDHSLRIESKLSSEYSKLEVFLMVRKILN